MYVCMSGTVFYFVQARARLDLRETATQSDAEDVVDIMKHRWHDGLCIQYGCDSICLSVWYIHTDSDSVLSLVPKMMIYIHKNSSSHSNTATKHRITNYLLVKLSTGFSLLVLCVSLFSISPQPGRYILRWSGQSGLWALSAGSRHESAQCCKTIDQRAAFACQEDQSEAVWPADASIGGRQSKREGEHIRKQHSKQNSGLKTPLLKLTCKVRLRKSIWVLSTAVITWIQWVGPETPKQMRQKRGSDMKFCIIHRWYSCWRNMSSPTNFLNSIHEFCSNQRLIYAC